MSQSRFEWIEPNRTIKYSEESPTHGCSNHHLCWFSQHCFKVGYPLVNVYIAMENHHAINGKTHYVYGHIFNSYLCMFTRGYWFYETNFFRSTPSRLPTSPWLSKGASSKARRANFCANSLAPSANVGSSPGTMGRWVKIWFMVDINL